MASRSEKGVLPVLCTDQSGFEAAFRRLERRREVRAEDTERSVRKIVFNEGDQCGLVFAALHWYDETGARVAPSPSLPPRVGEGFVVSSAERAGWGEADRSPRIESFSGRGAGGRECLGDRRPAG